MSPPTSETPPASDGATGRPRSVLVIDEPPSTRALARLLSGWGHEVRVADDGASALDQARRARPEVALIDLDLPGEDGVDLGDRLRETCAGLRIIALTASDRDEDRRRTRESSWDGHLVKPLDLGELGRLIG